MKLKVFGLFAFVSICLSHQTGFAQEQKDKIAKKVVDATHQDREIILSVKDFDNFTLLDSVRVVIGKQSKYTVNGIAVFENVGTDSITILSKPGYNRLIKKLSLGTMSVFLQKSTEVADGSIVNTSLYSRPAALFSGAAVTLSGDDLRKVNVISFIDALKYYVPSLSVSKNNNNGGDPNALPKIRLRGANALPFSATVGNSQTAQYGVQVAPSSGDFVAANIVSSGTPVIIMDGIQLSLQTALDLDINRIYSVTVLKDATATASYGMRGGNGVILIKTVKPQKGLLNVGITSELQIASADISSFNVLNAIEKLDLESKAGLYTVDLSPYYAKRYDQAYNKGVNTNWLKIPLRQGIGSRHSLSLSGGNDDMTYGLTAAYNDKEGSMKGSSRKTTELGAYFGGRLNAFSFNNQFSYLDVSASNSPYGSFDNYTKQNPYWSPYDPLTGKMQKVMEGVTIGGVLTNFMNPAYNATLATTDAADYSRVSNVTNMSFVFNEKLQLNGTIGITKQSDELNYFLPPNHTAFAEVTPENLATRGLYQYTSNEFTNVEGGLRLQYHNKFGQHEVYATAGQNLMQTSSESAGIIVQGFNVDRLADIAFGAGYATTKPIAGKIVTRYASTFANLVYSYAGRYQLDLSGANDLHSAIGENASRFWAAGLSWNINQESFLTKVDWINHLKLRGSIGTTGNQYFLSYLNRTTYNYYTNQQYIPVGNGSGVIGRGLGNYLTGYANDNLQSPQTLKENIGLDIALFGNRLSMSVDVYQQKTSKLILPDISSLSTSFVNYAYYQNYGSMENKGAEFNVMGTLYKSVRNNLSWNLRLNGAWNKDKVTEIAPYLLTVNSNNNTNANQTRLQPQYLKGYSPSAIWAVPSLGIDPQTGLEVFMKKDGSKTTVWDANDKVLAGDLLPSMAGSFGTDATFRQFSAGIYFNYQLGAKVYNQTVVDRVENANVIYNVDRRAAAQRWSPANTTDFVYKPLSVNGLVSAPTYTTTRMVQKDDKIQCAAIMLGYSLPKKLVSKINAKSIGLKCMINNAFEWGGADMERGIYYPFQRNYTFSLNANF